jgi:DDE superfamily endonuclease
MPWIRRVTAEQFLERGLEAVGFSVARQQRTRAATLVRRFRASFGASPGACSAIYRDLQTTHIANARIAKPDSHYFLVALNWLATYKKEEEMAGFFQCHEETLRKHIKKYVDAIAALRAQKIVWKDLNEDPVAIFPLSVDGIHCRANEPRKQPSATWCLPKLKQAALAYEVGISVYSNHIVWVSGPFPAAQHDLKTYQSPNGLRSKIPEGIKVIADRGYRGEDVGRTISIRNPQDSQALKDFKRRVRARHESVNARLKHFKILEDRFRHGVHRHKAVFEAVCVITQYDMENGHPLFDV